MSSSFDGTEKTPEEEAQAFYEKWNGSVLLHASGFFFSFSFGLKHWFITNNYVYINHTSFLKIFIWEHQHKDKFNKMIITLIILSPGIYLRRCNQRHTVLLYEHVQFIHVAYVRR